MFTQMLHKLSMHNSPQITLKDIMKFYSIYKLHLHELWVFHDSRVNNIFDMNLLRVSDRLCIVNLSSLTHYFVGRFDLRSIEKKRKGTWDQFTAYSFSKLLVVHTTKIFAWMAEGIENARVVSVYPGFVRTNIINNVRWISLMIEPISLLFFISRKIGTQTMLHCVLEQP
jgi:NAD(P)-dependent dehydrogenase (short-subunit alcohol dehydrogenase family)